MKLEELVNKHYEVLNDTDRIIWKYIYNHKTQCSKISIYDLAAACNVSRTTILRFAKKISLSGYSELKAHLRLELQETESMPTDQLDSIFTVYHRVFHELSQKNLTNIFVHMYQAPRIFACGTGVMQNNVVNEMIRLFNQGGDFIFNGGNSGEVQFLLNNLQENDMFVLISLSGENPQIINLARQLKLRNIFILSITKFKDNTLASLSNENIYIFTTELYLSNGEHLTKYDSITSYFIAVEILFLRYQLYKQSVSANNHSEISK